MKLSPRLNALYQFCLPGQPLWDLCCDHGQLGLWAAYSGQHPEVVFNDCVPQLIKSLEGKLVSLPHTRVICSPAETINEPLTGCVVIAGVGGEKINHILKTHAANDRLHAERLIVCPEKDAEWLMAQTVPGYQIHRRECVPHNQGHRWIAVYSALREPLTSKVDNLPRLS